MLVVGKKPNIFSTLHGIKNCVKNGTIRKIVSSNQCQHLARCGVTHNYFQSSLRILFTAFLETKTLEINVIQFGVLHWQQWQPPASVYEVAIFVVSFTNFIQVLIRDVEQIAKIMISVSFIIKGR